jgi:hypothetical protein
MKCVLFRWIDPKWDIMTLKVLKKLMEMKGKAEEEARSWKEACAAAKEEANVKAVELQKITRYYGKVTHNLFEKRKKMRNDALLSPTEKGEANMYLKAEWEARMWKEQCAKAEREIQETAAELQTVMQLLDSTTPVVKKVRELLRQASYKRSLSKDNNEE